jgi:hypothetical protein
MGLSNQKIISARRGVAKNAGYFKEIDPRFQTSLESGVNGVLVHFNAKSGTQGIGCFLHHVLADCLSQAAL